MTEKPAIALELWDVYDLVPHPLNAKRHSQEQVEGLARAFREDGFDQPIVAWSDKSVIKGHGRRLAVIHNVEHHGGSRIVPVICRRDLTKAQADAARLSDNRLVSTDYDAAMLQEEIARLAAEGEVDVSKLGFSEKELDFLQADLGEFNEDVFVDDVSQAVEEQKTENVTKAAEVDKSSAPVGDALGFKRVTVEQSRRVRGFMAAIEAKTGKAGIDALLAHIDTVVPA